MTFDEDSWIVWCPLRGNPALAYTYFPVGDPPPPLIVAEMVQSAYDRTPVVFFAPMSSPDGDEDIPLITQMITYLWVDDALWQPVSAVAEIPGIFTVTTTATPTTATWSGGDDPEQVVCTGPGVPYQYGVGGDDAQDQSCSMVYTRSSAVADRTLEVAVLWEVTVTCSIPTACGGSLPPITTVTTRDVAVAEIQALERS